MPTYRRFGWKEVTYDKKLDNFVPTLYIGLGGTGKDVLMRFRKRLYDKFGACREGFISFLAIDTDDQTDIPRGEQKADFERVVFDRNDEFIKCTIDYSTFKTIVNRAKTRNDRRYVNWLHPEIDAKISAGSLETGAGTHRQVGRLAFFNNYDSIRAAIYHHFKKMMAYAAGKPSSFFGGVSGRVYTERMEVVIVTSLAGGTGSGMFIDVAYLIRDILDHDPVMKAQVKLPHTTVIAVLPTIYANSDPSLADRFRQNGYSCLLEMEYYNTPRPEENPFRAEEDEKLAVDYTAVEFYVNWDDEHSPERPIKHHAWDTCYLIDDVNDAQRAAAREHSDVYQMVADYLFLDFGSSGFSIAKRSARSNHTQLKERILAAQVLDDKLGADLTEEGQRQGMDVVYENKYGCAFNSFGISEIFIDKDGVTRSASYRLALQLILLRWLGNAEDHTDATYDSWMKEDLFSGAPPKGQTQSISFHPDDMWKELLRDGQQGRDWLGLMTSHFDDIEGMPAEEGSQRLRRALEQHAEALAEKTRKEGVRGGARQTLDDRLSELSGTPTELGKMRQRLVDIARQRFNQIGAVPVLALLGKYNRAFRLAAKRARAQKQQKIPSDDEILARLHDAERVPFPCGKLAKRVEFERGCRVARSAAAKRYEVEAAANLEKLSNTLRVFVGEEGQEADAMPIHVSLHQRYRAVQDYLIQLADFLKRRFDETRKAKGSDRREPLLPEWSDAQYDQEINKALLHLGASGTKFNWAIVEDRILKVLDTVNAVNFVDSAVKAYDANPRSALGEYGERIALACRRVLGDRIDLSQFKNGNVVDYLTAMDDGRDDLLERMVAASSPYLPSIPPQERHNITPAYRNLLGRSGGKGTEGQANTAEIDKAIEGISQQIARRDGQDIQLAQIHSKEEGDPSQLVLVREMGGVPLHFYARLEELRKAYFARETAEFRKTCHIKFDDNWRSLPDIETIEDRAYQEIQQNVDYVLRALLLKFIAYDGDTSIEEASRTFEARKKASYSFLIKVPIEGEFGVQTYRLGARIGRVIKHACERRDIRRYLQQRWQNWLKDATPTHMAVLYNAIEHTQELFPRVVSAGDQQRIPPVRNCFRKLLRSVGEELRGMGPEGATWYELLSPRSEVSPDYKTWEPKYKAIADRIRATCLTQVPNENLPLYQIEEARIGEIRLPDESPQGG